MSGASSNDYMGYMTRAKAIWAHSTMVQPDPSSMDYSEKEEDYEIPFSVKTPPMDPDQFK